MSAEGLDELEIKLDQLADVDLNKAVGNAIQTVRSAAVEKKSWEENQLKQQMEDYRERRKAYIAEVNRRRQLGL